MTGLLSHVALFLPEQPTKMAFEECPSANKPVAASRMP
jgi:hypothetical protein